MTTFAWLIEREEKEYGDDWEVVGSHPVYVGMTQHPDWGWDTAGWTTDAYKALRFSRKEDADFFRKFCTTQNAPYVERDGVSIEHGFEDEG